MMWIFLLLYSKLAASQAPASDLTNYPSGLASIAVVAYYALASDKDNLPHRRRVAGFGVEHLARDLSFGSGGGKRQDKQIKGITINRRPIRRQQSSWEWTVCMKRGDTHAFDNHFDGASILDNCTEAFRDISASVKKLIEEKRRWLDWGNFGTEGHWLAGVAAFCKAVDKISNGRDILEKCREDKENHQSLLIQYALLRELTEEATNMVKMPDTSSHTQELPKDLYVAVDTWEGGGRPIHVRCDIFISIVGHCVGFSYGELMAGAHRRLDNASWAASIYISLPEPVDATSKQEELTPLVKQALKESRFYQQTCDLRVWGHRFGDYMASLVAGCLIAALVSLGSTAGSCVSVTSAAVADPKPVAGLTSAAWGYPVGRRSHMEARDDPKNSSSIVCIARQSKLVSF